MSSDILFLGNTENLGNLVEVYKEKYFAGFSSTSIIKKALYRIKYVASFYNPEYKSIGGSLDQKITTIVTAYSKASMIKFLNNNGYKNFQIKDEV